MDELLKILSIEDEELINKLKDIDQRDPHLVLTIKDVIKTEKSLAKFLKKSSDLKVFDKHNIDDVLRFALHDYHKKTINIGRHRSSYEKLVEESKKYLWIDLVANYEKLVFEPKEMDAWLSLGNIVPGKSIIVYGKSIDTLHNKDTNIALSGLANILGREIKTQEKTILKGQPHIKRVIVNCGRGLHIRPISEMIESAKPYIKKGGAIKMIYGEEMVNLAPNNVLSVIALGVDKGSELIFEFYGEGYKEPYEGISKALNSPIFYKNNSD